MLVHEWTERTGHEPTAGEWEVVNTVYGFHPAIPDVGGKDKLAAIFALGGFGLIGDMLPVAEQALALDRELNAAKRALAEREQAMAEARALVCDVAARILALHERYGRA